jgi:hypothetical protein
LSLKYKRKAELVGQTLVKALRSSAAIMIRTTADDAAWVAKYQAVVKWLRLQEVAAQIGAST